MSLFGPLPAQKFLALLRRVGEGEPDRSVLADILDGAIEAAGAERGFLLRERPGGGFRVLLARSFDGQPVSHPAERISHHAVRRVGESAEAHLVADARRDRRYRTEEARRIHRGPMSILAFPIRLRTRADVCLYLDHRFRALPVKGASVEAVEHWRALLGLALQARERNRLLARAWTGAGRPAPAVGGEAGGPPRPAVPAAPVDFHGFLAATPDMLDLVDAARLIARSDLPAVIQGETGSGKEVLARAIHLESPRREKPFLVVPCGGVPDNLLESELFGHARGAFTGAEGERTGLLVQADGGTVLLDEVGDMSPRLQQGLLRFLEDGRVRPLGGREAVRIDLRVLSSTQKEFERLVEGGSFRRDLFYRLRGAVLLVPPLRERREEILPMAERFLRRFSEGSGKEPPALGDSVRRRLVRHSWPGNVREIENEMRRLAALGTDPIEEKDLSPFLRSGDPGGPAPPTLEIARVVSEAERGAISAALVRAGGNKSRAAKILGITRKALYRRMERYGLK